jgi:phage terminase large subunit-like protein
MIVKSRNNTASWIVYHKDIGNTKAIYLNSSSAASTASSGWWDNTTPTDTVFTLGANTTQSSNNYIAYLFASLDGISKVGSYTGDGNATQDIDCGFSSGARFVLIKSTNATGNWFLFDTERGIVAGNDSRLELNSTSAEVTTADVIDPLASGFTVTNQSIGINVSGREYIFLAIA